MRFMDFVRFAIYIDGYRREMAKAKAQQKKWEEANS